VNIIYKRSYSVVTICQYLNVREKVTGGQKYLRKEKLNNLYSLPLLLE
jgi:hypothetical protein